MDEYEDEIWRDVPGYEGLYLASNLGRIKSLGRSYYAYNYLKHEKVLYTQKPRILKTHKKKSGYCGAILTDKDGRLKHHYVHRIVAMTFIPNPDNCKEVNHKNWDTSDNRVENLEWVNRTENVRKRRFCIEKFYGNDVSTDIKEKLDLWEV